MPVLLERRPAVNAECGIDRAIRKEPRERHQQSLVGAACGQHDDAIIGERQDLIREFTVRRLAAEQGDDALARVFGIQDAIDGADEEGARCGGRRGGRCAERDAIAEVQQLRAFEAHRQHAAGHTRARILHDLRTLARVECRINDAALQIASDEQAVADRPGHDDVVIDLFEDILDGHVSAARGLDANCSGRAELRVEPACRIEAIEGRERTVVSGNDEIVVEERRDDLDFFALQQRGAVDAPGAESDGVELAVLVQREQRARRIRGRRRARGDDESTVGQTRRNPGECEAGSEIRKRLLALDSEILIDLAVDGEAIERQPQTCGRRAGHDQKDGVRRRERRDQMRGRRARGDPRVETDLRLPADPERGVRLAARQKRQQPQNRRRLGDDDQPSRRLQQQVARRERYPGDVDGDRSLVAERFVEEAFGQIALQKQDTAAGDETPPQHDDVIVRFTHYSGHDVADGLECRDRHVAVATPEASIDLGCTGVDCVGHRQRADRRQRTASGAAHHLGKQRYRELHSIGAHDCRPIEKWSEFSMHASPSWRNNAGPASFNSSASTTRRLRRSSPAASSG